VIDLHCHILPGVDDGAASDEEALEMLHIAEEDGIDRIVATPHVPPKPGQRLSPEEILMRVGALNKLATGSGIPIQVLAGSEVRFEPGIVEALQQGEFLSLNGSPYVLLELPLFGDWPSKVRATVFELQMAGFIPVLAHVERYPAVQRDPDRLIDLVTTGVVMQLNADSIRGGADSRAARTARRLLTSRMAHLVASDAHSPRSRAPRVAAAFRRVGELVDPEYAAWMKHASETVLDGGPLILPEPPARKSGRWWSRLWPS
jgi:protein-tyrosine phosphatase